MSCCLIQEHLALSTRRENGMDTGLSNPCNGPALEPRNHRKSGASYWYRTSAIPSDTTPNLSAHLLEPPTRRAKRKRRDLAGHDRPPDTLDTEDAGARAGVGIPRFPTYTISHSRDGKSRSCERRSRDGYALKSARHVETSTVHPHVQPHCSAKRRGLDLYGWHFYEAAPQGKIIITLDGRSGHKWRLIFDRHRRNRHIPPHTQFVEAVAPFLAARQQDLM